MGTRRAARSPENITNDPATWVDQEVKGCGFKDVRLAKRFGKLLGMMSDGIGQSIPQACQDWADTKAAYRFLSNDGVAEDQILAGHFQATRGRLAQTGQKILMLHDTCEFSFQRNKDSTIGLLGRPSCGKGKDGRTKFITLRGLLMHGTLAITPEGLPLGLAAIKFWSRQQFKGCNALKRKINPTRVPIEEKESFRWLENLRQATALAGNPGGSRPAPPTAATPGPSRRTGWPSGPRPPGRTRPGPRT